jgi:hypothetical protein
MSARGLLRIIEGGQVAFWCAGCESAHAISIAPGGWKFNGDYDKPTFTPSVLVTSGHYSADFAERKRKDPAHDCWCTFRQKHPGVTTFECFRCHLFVKDGFVQFLADCTHELAGKTVPLEAIPC